MMRKKLLLLLLMLPAWHIMWAQYCTSGLFEDGCSRSVRGNVQYFNLSVFSLGTYSDSTGCSVDAYLDQTQTPIGLSSSATPYPISVATECTFNSMYGAIWVDWNDDGDFDDPSEFIDSSSSTFNKGVPWLTSISIGQNAPAGNHRLRVRVSDTWPFSRGDACELFGYGETQDYTINVLPVAGACAAFSDVKIDSISGDGVKVDWTPASSSGSFVLEYGTTGFQPGTGQLVSGTYPSAQPPVAITGLSNQTGYDVYIKEYCNAGVDSIYLTSPFKFTTTACAPDPTNFSLDQLYSNGGDFSWYQVGSYQSFTLIYDTLGFNPASGGTILTSASLSASINGLNGGRWYDVYLFTNCVGGGATSDTVGPLSFKTECIAPATLSLPYSENFIGAQGTYIGNDVAVYCTQNANWSFETNKQAYGTVSFDKQTFWSSQQKSGVTIETNTVGEEPANLLIGTFNMSNYDTSSSSFIVLSFDHLDHYDDNDPGDKVFVRGSENDPWLVLYDLDQNGVSTQWVAANNLDVKDTLKKNGQNFSSTFQIAFGQEDSENSSQIVWDWTGAGGRSFDNIWLEQKSCLELRDVTLSNVDSNSVDVYVGDSAVSFEYKWGACGFSQASATYSSASGFVSLTGLPSGQCIDLYVRKNCGAAGSSDWTGPYTFQTECGYFSAPYFQDFQSVVSPEINKCFKVYVQYPFSNPGDVIVNNPDPSAPDSNFAGEVILFDNNSTSMSTLTLVSPAFYDMDSTKQIRMDVYANPDVSDLIIGTMSDAKDISTFTPYDTLLGSEMKALNWENFVIRFDRYKGTDKNIALQHKATRRRLYIDNYSYESIPDCITPELKTLGIDDYGLDWAQVYWGVAGHGSKTYISWGALGFQPGYGPLLDSVVGTIDTFRINGLQAQTDYEFYIQDSCISGGKSDWIGPIKFTTGCSPIVAPYFENFDSSPFSSPGDSISSCWKRNAKSGDQQYSWRVGRGSTPTSYTGPSADNSGTGNYLYTEANEGSSYDMAVLYSPLVDISGLNNPEMSFYVHRVGFHLNSASARFMVEINDGRGWDTLHIINGGLQSQTTDPFQEVKLDISTYDDTVQLRFSTINGGIAGDNAIDDVSFHEGPIACTNINSQSVTAGNISDTSAVLSWTGGVSATSYQVWYGPAGFIQGTQAGGGTQAVTSNSSYTIDTLVEASCYEYLVRSICTAGDTSSWVGPKSFCTLLSCPSPTGPGVILNSIDTNGATIYWIGGGASYYNVEYGISGFTRGSGTFISTQNDTIPLTGLPTGAAYEFYVQDSCAIGNVSTWTGPGRFVTAFPTNYLEDFSSNHPTGWEHARGTLSTNTNFTSSGSSWYRGSFGNAGSNMSRYVIYGTSSRNEWLISPAIFLDPGITNLQVEFDAAITTSTPTPAQGYLNPNDSIALLISTDNGDTWSSTDIIWQIGASDTVDMNGEHFVVPLTGYSGTIRLAFYAASLSSSVYDGYFYVDNFEVRTPRVCADPSNFVISNIGRDSVVATWDHQPSNFVSSTVYYMQSGYPVDSAKFVSGLSDSTVIGNLKPGTSYCSYVVVNCSFGYSDTIGPVCFTTECVKQNLPYFENFNTSLGCFIPVNGGSTEDTWTHVLSSSNSLNGTPYAIVNSSAAGTGVVMNEILLSPEIDASATNTVVLTFDHYFYNYFSTSDSGFVEVFDGTQWNVVKTYDTNVGSFSSPATDVLDISAYANANLRVRFRYKDDGMWAKYWAIDNILIRDICLASSPNVVNVGCDSIQLDWASQSGQSVVIYYPKGGAINFSPIVSPPYTVNNLTPGTAYTFEIADVCSNDTSVFESIIDSTSSGPVPSATFTFSKVLSANGQSMEVYVDASGSQNSKSYLWDFGVSQGNGVMDTVIYSSQDNGIQTITLVVTNACGSDTLTQSVNVNIDLAEFLVNNGVSIFPNPASNEVNVEFMDEFAGNANLRLIDIQGRILRSEIIKSQGSIMVYNMDVSKIQKGSYIVAIELDGYWIYKKLLIE